jgi:hypothetical protein
MRNRDIPRESIEFAERLRRDPYFNAVRAKYGWAVTCHKAQGGEWQSVFVEFEGAYRGEGDFRWVYTALTRSKANAFLIDPPDFGPGTRAASELERSSSLAEEIRARVTTALGDAGLQVETRQLQWCLRCEVAQEADRAVVDVNYRSDGRISGIRPASNSPAEGLGQRAVAILTPLMSDSIRPASQEVASTLDALEESLTAHLAEAGATIVAIRNFDYQVRYEIARGVETATVSLYYNKRGELTDSRPSPESSAALVEIVRKVLASL